MRYLCNLCDHTTTTSSRLKIHIENKQEGVRYPRNQCEYTVTTASRLKIHNRIKPEGVRWPCNQCEYASTTANRLKTHNIIKQMKWVIHATNVYTLPPKQVILRDISKIIIRSEISMRRMWSRCYYSKLFEVVYWI